MFFSFIPLVKRDALVNREGNAPSQPKKGDLSRKREQQGDVLAVSGQEKEGMRGHSVALRGTHTAADQALAFHLLLPRLLLRGEYLLPENNVSTGGFEPFPSVNSSKREARGAGLLSLESTLCTS